MMLSVIKNTHNPVKFWFLKNFLSPTFKVSSPCKHLSCDKASCHVTLTQDFIPHMARKYGFEYELVEYKWPRWLHAQTQKQRIIWGYKILFLDVLFPLSVKKIIFVDADQVKHDRIGLNFVHNTTFHVHVHAHAGHIPHVHAHIDF